MSKGKIKYIVADMGDVLLPKDLKSIVSMVSSHGVYVMARHGVNKKTLRKILRKRLSVCKEG